MLLFQEVHGERGICLPDVSVYLELCEILGISLNEFLAGEDIEVTNVEKKSEDTLIQISKDSSHKQRYLKKIIVVLLIAVVVFAITLLIIRWYPLCGFQNLFLSFRYSLGEYPFNL